MMHCARIWSPLIQVTTMPHSASFPLVLLCALVFAALPLCHAAEPTPSAVPDESALSGRYRLRVLDGPVVLDDVPLELLAGQKATLENSTCVPYFSGVSYPRPDDDRPPLPIASCAPSGHRVSIARDPQEPSRVVLQASLSRLEGFDGFTTEAGIGITRAHVQQFEIHESVDLNPREAVSYLKSEKVPLQVELSRLD